MTEEITAKVQWNWSNGRPHLVLFDGYDVLEKTFQLTRSEAQALVDAGVDHGS